MASIFTKIIARELPAYIIAEDDKHLAFLDAMPLMEGHCLVIPKEETDFIFDIGSKEHQELWDFARTVALQLGKAYPKKRVAVAVVGLEVPHAHIHLLPITAVSDMNFANERVKFTPEQYKEIQQKILAS